MQELNCFTSDSPKRKPTKSGRLDGLTFVAKDLISIKGHISSFGHAQWRKTHKAADKDSSILTKLLSEGAELIGTAKMDQLAYSIIGNIGEGKAPVNTRYPERFCGGSSSGSVSAVAGELVDFAIGSDTGGSVRIPAAACGVYGIRTTQGLIPKDGVIDFAKSADVLGFLARDAETLRLVTSIFSFPSKELHITKLLLPSNIEDYTNLDIEVFRSMVREVSNRKNLDLEEVDVSKWVSQEVKDLFARIQSREIWAEHGAWAEQNMQYLAEEVQTRLANCKKLSSDDKSITDQDAKLVEQYCHDLQELIGNTSALCLPILPIAGPNRDLSGDELLQFRNQSFMNIAPSSLSGLPQLSAPLTNGTSNIGLIGPKFSDLGLIDLFC